jgi:hypothetical protein
MVGDPSQGELSRSNSFRFSIVAIKKRIDWAIHYRVESVDGEAQCAIPDFHGMKDRATSVRHFIPRFLAKTRARHFLVAF